MNTPNDWRDALQQLRAEIDTSTDTSADTSTDTLTDSLTGASGAKPTLLIEADRKRRGGKVSTIISGFDLDEDALRDLAARLKHKLATGGSARSGEILLQGDCRQAAATALKQLGYKLKGQI